MYAALGVQHKFPHWEWEVYRIFKKKKKKKKKPASLNITILLL